jgi:hypothetical protein
MFTKDKLHIFEDFHKDSSLKPPPDAPPAAPRVPPMSINFRTVCRRHGCSKKLRSDNRSGFCRAHHQLSGACRRCLNPCTRGRKYCVKCIKRVKAERATSKVMCTAVGCTVKVHSRTSLCRVHWAEGGGPCTVLGCENKVVFNSRWGLCRSHAHVAKKLREQKPMKEVVVIEQVGNRFHIVCTVCKQFQSIPQPVAASRLADFGQRFARQHRSCAKEAE